MVCGLWQKKSRLTLWSKVIQVRSTPALAMFLRLLRPRITTAATWKHNKGFSMRSLNMAFVPLRGAHGSSRRHTPSWTSRPRWRPLRAHLKPLAEARVRKKHRHGLHDYIVREIGQQIISGRFPVGIPIPPDTTLCSALHISRTALREALIVLAAKGLLEARQKIGTVVRPREEWAMLDADVLLWRVESHEGDYVIAELYDLRRLIEPLAASLAA